MTTIDRLETERAALLARIEEIDSLIKEFHAWEKRVATVVPNNSADAEPQRPLDVAGATRRWHFKSNEVQQKQGHNQGTPMPQFIAAVERILAEAEAPLNRTALLQKLQEADIDVGGTDPRNTLSARMSRLRDFVNLSGFGYWARGRDFDQAGYEAASSYSDA